MKLLPVDQEAKFTFLVVFDHFYPLIALQTIYLISSKIERKVEQHVFLMLFRWEYCWKGHWKNYLHNLTIFTTGIGYCKLDFNLRLNWIWIWILSQDWVWTPVWWNVYSESSTEVKQCIYSACNGILTVK